MKTSTFCKLVKRLWITSDINYICSCADSVAQSLSLKTNNIKLKQEYNKHKLLVQTTVQNDYLKRFAGGIASYLLRTTGSAQPQEVAKFRLKILNDMIYKFKELEKIKNKGKR